MKALIVGAGIGGLAAALALKDHCTSILVLEQALCFEEIGAGLQLSPNATRVLARWGLLAPLCDIGIQLQSVEVRGARRGTSLMRIPMGECAAQRWGAPFVATHRHDLHALLLEKVSNYSRIDCHANTNVTGVEIFDTSVRVTGDQAGVPATWEADVVIGADGVHSILRRILGHSPAIPSGHVAWRAMLKSSTQAKILQDSVSLWLDHQAHGVFYPVRGRDAINAVLCVKSPETGVFSDQIFSHWHADFRDIIAQTPPEAWRPWPLYECPSISYWGQGRVTLLGDAAHGMLPFLAQGAAQAIEDAGVLEEIMGRGMSLQQSLRAYEQARAMRIKAIQEASRWQGQIYHMSGWQAVLRNVIMRLTPTSLIHRRFDWIYSA